MSWFGWGAEEPHADPVVEEARQKAQEYAVQLTKLSKQKSQWLTRETGLKERVASLEQQLTSMTAAVPRIAVASARSAVEAKLSAVVSQQAGTPSTSVAGHARLERNAAELRQQLDAFDAAEDRAKERSEAKLVEVDAAIDAASVATKRGEGLDATEIARRLHAMEIAARAASMSALDAKATERALRTDLEHARSTNVRLRTALGSEQSALVRALQKTEVEQARLAAELAEARAEKDATHVADVESHRSLQLKMQKIAEALGRAREEAATLRLEKDAEINALNAKVVRLVDSASTAGSRNASADELRSELAAMARSAEALQDVNAELIQRERAAAKKQARAEAAVASLRAAEATQKSLLVQNLRTKDTEVHELLGEISALNELRDDTHASEVKTHANLEARIAALSSALAQATAEREALRHDDEVEALALKERVSALVTELNGAGGTLGELNATLGALRVSHDEMRARVRDTEEQLRQERERSAALEAAGVERRSALVAELRAAERAQAVLEARAAELRATMDATHSGEVAQHAALQRELASTTAQLADAAEERARLVTQDAAQITALNAKVARLVDDARRAAASGGAASLTELSAAVGELRAGALEGQARERELHAALARECARTAASEEASVTTARQLHDNEVAQVQLEAKIASLRETKSETSSRDVGAHRSLKAELSAARAELERTSAAMTALKESDTAALVTLHAKIDQVCATNWEQADEIEDLEETTLAARKKLAAVAAQLVATQQRLTLATQRNASLEAQLGAVKAALRDAENHTVSEMTQKLRENEIAEQSLRESVRTIEGECHVFFILLLLILCFFFAHVYCFFSSVSCTKRSATPSTSRTSRCIASSSSSSRRLSSSSMSSRRRRLRFASPTPLRRRCSRARSSASSKRARRRGRRTSRTWTR